jgi:uncharacterized membrane protein
VPGRRGRQPDGGATFRLIPFEWSTVRGVQLVLYVDRVRVHRKESTMSRVEHTIDVDVPVRAAYGQWTQFESFPRFMDGVVRVIQGDDKTLVWWVTVGGQRKEWTAEIVDQTPDRRIAWKSTQGTENAGAVMFEPLGPETSRITLRIDAEPDGILERMGDAAGFLDRRVSGDLERFKAFIEARSRPTGGWRGEIHGDVVEPDASEATGALPGSRPGSDAA